jgi:hypothetical protein
METLKMIGWASLGNLAEKLFVHRQLQDTFAKWQRALPQILAMD